MPVIEPATSAWNFIPSSTSPESLAAPVAGAADPNKFWVPPCGIDAQHHLGRIRFVVPVGDGVGEAGYAGIILVGVKVTTFLALEDTVPFTALPTPVIVSGSLLASMSLASKVLA